MRSLVLLFFVFTNALFAKDWVITSGGLSPSKKFAVAVIPQKTENIDEETDTRVHLIDQKSNKVVGPLIEVNSAGGLWGTTTENVSCAWSKDSNYLIVNYRAGRLCRDFQIYRIVGRRAVPILLPIALNHPKAKILDILKHGSNSGSIGSFSSDGSISVERYGFEPIDGNFNRNFQNYDLPDFNPLSNSLILHYKVEKSGEIKLYNLTKGNE